jgi:hypothetical protein
VTTSTRKQEFQAARAAADRKLRLQLIIFSLVFLVVIGIAVFRIVSDGLSTFGPLVGFAVGLVIGTLMARGRPMTWDSSGSEIVSSTTIFGVAITLVYFASKLLPENVVSRLVTDPNMVSVIGLTITGGLMLGRVLFMVRTIRRLVQDEPAAEQPNV